MITRYSLQVSCITLFGMRGHGYHSLMVGRAELLGATRKVPLVTNQILLTLAWRIPAVDFLSQSQQNGLWDKHSGLLNFANVIVGFGIVSPREAQPRTQHQSQQELAVACVYEVWRVPRLLSRIVPNDTHETFASISRKNSSFTQGCTTPYQAISYQGVYLRK